MSDDLPTQMNVPAMDLGDEPLETPGGAPAGKKPKKSLPRRILKWTFWLIFVLLLVVVAVVGWLHTSSGQDYVRSKIVDRVQTTLKGGSFSLGNLDYALFGDVIIKDVAVKTKDDALAATVKSLTVKLDWWSLASDTIEIHSIELAGVDAVLTPKPKPKKPPEPPQEKAPPADKTLDLKSLTVRDVNLTVNRPDGSVLVVKDLGLDASLVANAFQKKVQLSAPSLRFSGLNLDRADGVRLVVGPLKTSLTANVDGSTIEAKWPGAELAASLTRPDGVVVDLPIKFDGLAVNKTGEAINLNVSKLLAGAVSLEALTANLHTAADALTGGQKQRFNLSKLHLSAEALNKLLGKKTLLSDVDVNVVAEGPASKLVLKGSAKTAAGTLGVHGWVDISDPLIPRYELTLGAPKVVPAKLLAGDLPDIRTSLTIVIKGKGIQSQDMDTKFDVTVGATSIGKREIEGLNLHAHAKQGKMVLNDLKLSVLGHAVELDGDFDPKTRAVNAHFTTSADLQKLAKRIDEAGILKVPLPPIKGEDFVIDIRASATLLDADAVKALPPSPPGEFPGQLPRLPAENATLTGSIRGKNLDDGRVKVGRLDVAVDLKVVEAAPSGVITVELDDVETATGTKIDEVRGKILVDNTSYTLTLSGRNLPPPPPKEGVKALASKKTAQKPKPKPKVNFEVVVKGTVNPSTLDVTAELQKLVAEVGELSASLANPVTLALPPGLAIAGADLNLPRTVFNIAGGTVTVRGGAKMSQDKEKPKPERIDGDITIKGLRVSKLPRAVRRKLRGIGGTLNGNVSVRGTPSDPALSFAISTFARGFGVSAKGGLMDKRLDADVTLRRRGKVVLVADVSAPLILPAPGKKGKPRLSPGGRLVANVRIPRGTPLKSFVAPLAKKLLPKVGDGTMDLRVSVRGSAARPRITVNSDVEGIPVEKLKTTIATHFALNLDRVSGGTEATGSFGVTSADGKLPPISGTIAAEFKGSPLTRRDKRPRSATIVLNALDLGALVDALPLPAATAAKLKGLSGTAGTTIALKPVGRKAMAATITTQLGGITLPKKLNAVDGTIVLNAGPAGVGLVSGLSPQGDGTANRTPEQHAVRLKFELPGDPKLLQKRLKQAQKGALDELGKTKLVMSVDIDDTAASLLRDLSPLAPKLPGTIKSDLSATGTFAQPKLSGGLRYAGYDTIAGSPGRAAFVWKSSGPVHTIGIETGPKAKMLALSVAVDAKKLFNAYVMGEGALSGTLKVTAPKVDVATLLPKALVNFGKHTFKGVIDSDLVATLGAAYDDDMQLKPLAPTSTGAFRFVDGVFGVGGTPRKFHDIQLALNLNGGARLEKLELLESDEEHKNRRLTMSGVLPLVGGKPGDATFDLSMDRFLAIAPAFDSPEGEVTMKATVTATKITSLIPKITVAIEALKVHRPSRFVRDHYQQKTHLGDLVFVGDEQPVGRLPIIKPKAVLGIDAEPAADAEPGGVDVRIEFPKKAEVLNFPLDFHLTGNIDLAIRKGPAVKLNCDVRFFDGKAKVMGMWLDLAEGGMTCPGAIRDFEARFLFKKDLPDPAARDQSQASSGGPLTFEIIADAKGLPRTYPGGAAGTYLVDAFAVLNAANARMLSGPGHPASATVQMPGGDEQPMVLTFLQTNLSHLLFLTRINLWSRPGDLFGEYGKVRNLEGDRYVDDDMARVRMIGRERTTATSAAELRYDRFLARSKRSVFGIGGFAGSAPGLGVELFVEWSSEN